MLDVTEQLADDLQQRLNRPDALAAWDALLQGDEFARHRDMEHEPYDTTFSVFHRAATAMVSRYLDGVRRDRAADRTPGASLLGRWLPCADVFALSKPDARTSEWVRDRVGDRPLIAFRVGCTVFYLPGVGERRWQRRAWGRDSEPLMRLPYQRKYDRERHGQADMQLRSSFERLQVASDLLTVAAERLEDMDTRSAGFSWPDGRDISAEMNALGLSFGIDSLASMGGGVTLSIGAVRQHHPDTTGRRVDFTIEDGVYRGALGGYHRRPNGMLRAELSAASLKWMTGCALTDLRERLSEIITGVGCPPPEDE